MKSHMLIETVCVRARACVCMCASGLAYVDLFFLLFPLCRGEAGLLVTAKYGYFRD